jgi:hypothetical protein
MKALTKQILSWTPGLFLLFPLFYLQTEQRPIDNITVLNNLATTIVQQIVDNLQPDSAATILIRSRSQQHPGNWWIENWFIKGLHRKGVTQILLNQSPVPDGQVIEFQINSIGVDYSSTNKKNRVKRQCKVELTVRAFEAASERITFIDEFNEQYSDSVWVGDLRELESSEISFTIAKKPAKKGWNQLIEPFIVLTTTAGVIYLFFQLRSN